MTHSIVLNAKKYNVYRLFGHVTGAGEVLIEEPYCRLTSGSILPRENDFLAFHFTSLSQICL